MRNYGKQSEISGAPPAGVSQPLDPQVGGGYRTVERGHTPLHEATHIISEHTGVKTAHAPRGPQPRRRSSYMPDPNYVKPVAQRTMEPIPKQLQVQPNAMNTGKGRQRLPEPAEVVPLQNRRRTGIKNPIAEVHSVDEKTYRFHKMSAGSKNPTDTFFDIAMVSLICQVEAMKGGNPLDVLEAFKINLSDAEGETFFDWRDADYYRELSQAITFGTEPEDDYSDYTGAGVAVGFFEEGDDF